MMAKISNDSKPQVHNTSDTIERSGASESFLGNLLKSLDEVMSSSTRHHAVARRPRILVCTPSNAAIDEIIIRIMETSFKDCKSKEYKPHIVRLGRGAHKSVEAVSLESLVKKVLQTNFRERYTLVKEKEDMLASIKTYIREQIHKIQQIPSTDMENREIEANLLFKAHDDFDKTRTEYFQYIAANDNNRKQVEVAILDSADIVLTTLSSSGLQVLEELKLEERMFDTVVIDESAQSIELSTLIPLR